MKVALKSWMDCTDPTKKSGPPRATQGTNKFSPGEMEADWTTKHSGSQCSSAGQRDESAHLSAKGATSLN